MQLLLEIMGLPPNLPPCLGETSYMLRPPRLRLVHSFPMLTCDLDVLCEYSFEVTGDENDIPNWFNHQRDGYLISFSIGPEFPTIALCIAFGIQDSFCEFNYYVIISINGSARMFERKFIAIERNFGRLSFSCRPQSSLQELFRDLQLTDRNHVEILCIPFHPSKIAPIVERIGVHVECNCPTFDSSNVIVFDLGSSPVAQPRTPGPPIRPITPTLFEQYCTMLYRRIPHCNISRQDQQENP